MMRSRKSRRPAQTPVPSFSVRRKAVAKTNIEPARGRTHSLANITTLPAATGIQPKLTVGAPDDAHEREADSVADQVMNMPDRQPSVAHKANGGVQNKIIQRDSKEDEDQVHGKLIQRMDMDEDESLQGKLIQRKCAACEDEEKVRRMPAATDERDEEDKVHRQSDSPREDEETMRGKLIQRECANCAGEEDEARRMADDEDDGMVARQSTGPSSGMTPGVESNIRSLKGGGSPMPDSLRSFMEPRFGRSFDHVRIHTDSRAAATANSIGAKAYTLGNDVVFGQGQFSPGTNEGKRLIAHELTHVVQQKGGVQPQRIQRLIYSNASLKEYLKTLDKRKTKVGGMFSDDKALAVVQRWQKGNPHVILNTHRKALLIEELMYYVTFPSEQKAITALFRGSTKSVRNELWKKIGESRLKAKMIPEDFASVKASLGGPRERSTGFASEKAIKFQDKYEENALKPTKKENPNATDIQKDCITIITKWSPFIFNRTSRAKRKKLAWIVRRPPTVAGKRGWTMTTFSKKLTRLRLARGPRTVKFKGGNGNTEPKALASSFGKTILSMVGKKDYGWHFFGVAMFNGYHSLAILVDRRPNATFLYWADQWDDSNSEVAPKASPGFRQYTASGLDRAAVYYTNRWWLRFFLDPSIKNEKAKRRNASIHIWKYRV